ncbi:rna polymerase II ctd phosphatase [Clonorchis sinensis]|uniref:Rna polymerase II ctd phosphatase n=1 Tax=Clonorchis sinensis TaxID=79923 RepID=G7YG98_CLOSI|nr:rna polymerase II ctd phosphatase [Clonorchis sinensis]
MLLCSSDASRFARSVAGTATSTLYRARRRAFVADDSDDDNQDVSSPPVASVVSVLPSNEQDTFRVHHCNSSSTIPNHSPGSGHLSASSGTVHSTVNGSHESIGKKRSHLRQLYQPPVEIMFDGSLSEGWGPETRSHSLHGFRSHTTPRSVSVSPAIHSDPEPSLDWWRSEDAQACDFREWNTCPEGYDYEDAERTRALLMRDARADELRSYAERLHKTHRSLTRCLFGTDDEGDASNEEDDAENDEPSDSSVEESDDPEEDEDLDHERWEPLREFM